MNAKSGSGSSGTFVWGLVAGLVALLGAGGLYMSGLLGNDPAPQPLEVETAVQEPVAKPAPAEETQTEAQPAENKADEETAETPVPEAESAEEDEPTLATAVAPVLDQIFVEPDGNALLSGNAEPGAKINVVLDGETVHSFTVDDSGQFAEFVVIPFADAARGLVLETEGGEKVVQSDDYLIAALPKPEPQEEAPEVAQAQPAVPETPAETVEEDVAQVEVPEAETAADVPGNEASETPVPEGSAAEETETAVADPVPNDVTPTEETPETTEETDQQVAILRSGQEGVELVQPPTEDETPPDQVALDTIGYSESGEVELTGRVQDESTVRLYLDNELVADLDPVDDGQWRGEIEGVDPGVYTLRVDEVSPEGDVVSRIETPFKREPIETLRAADVATDPDATGEVAPIRSVTVQKGDTLWAISRDRFGDGVLYVKLFEANRAAIRDPDLIYPGQIFTIPD